MTSHEYALQMNRYFLAPIGIWAPGQDDSLVVRLLRRLAVSACYWLICFLLVPCGLHMFLEVHDPAVKLKLIGPLSFCLMAIAKYNSFVDKTGEIRDCLQHLRDDWQSCSSRASELEVMQRNAKLGRFMTTMCAAFMYGGGFFYHTVMPLSIGRIATADLHRQQRLDHQLSSNGSEPDFQPHGQVRVLTWPIYRRFFHVDQSPTYELMFGAQFVSGFVLYTITIAACSFAASCVVHVCGQLEIVMQMLRDFVRPGSKLTISDIVQRHLRALSFASKVESNLNYICFVEFIGCTMNMCFLEYYFITEWESSNMISTMTYCILLVSFTFNIFIFCYIGELLTEQCKKVGEVAYGIDWHLLPSKKALDLILIIEIASSHPAKITAGKMVNLSLSTFCNVIKTSATYLNLLRTVM